MQFRGCPQIQQNKHRVLVCICRVRKVTAVNIRISLLRGLAEVQSELNLEYFLFLFGFTVEDAAHKIREEICYVTSPLYMYLSELLTPTPFGSKFQF